MEIKRTKENALDFIPEVKVKHKGKEIKIDGRDRERVEWEINRPLGHTKKTYRVS
jgi:hypothetical protein